LFTHIQGPNVVEQALMIGEQLAEGAKDICDLAIIAPVYLSLDKKIYFHGGDYLPFTHLPMPYGANEDPINQMPGIREVRFVPLHSALITNKLAKILPPPDLFGERVFEHAEYIMQAIELGAKVYVNGDVYATYKKAYKPTIGQNKFSAQLVADLAVFDKKWANTLDQRLRYPVNLHSIVSYGGGYNLHSYNVAKTLFEQGVRTFYQFIGGTNADEDTSGNDFVDDSKSVYGALSLPQITICHGVNNYKNSGGYKIAFTTTEVEGVPRDWVQCMNDMNEVWMTSQFALDSFKRSGVRVPMYNIGEGVDPGYFHPGITPFTDQPKQKFRFMSNFAWGRRKGVDVLFEAFRREFDADEDVCLMLKTLPSYQGHKIKDELKLLYNRKDAAPVYLYDLEFPKWELARFYTMGSVFLWPSRGEGYGLPPLEALACGMPVLASNHSAHLEFLTKNGKPRPGVELIEGTVDEYKKGDSIYYYGFHWFNPSVDDMREKMRKMYNEYEDYKKGALKSTQDVRKEFDWHVSTSKIVARLADIYQKHYHHNYKCLKQ